MTGFILAVLMLAPQEKNMEHLMNYGVKIHVVVSGEDGEGFGSGVFVENDLILTANHLYYEGARYFINEEHTEEVFIVKYDEDNDLMLLRSKGKHKHASLGSMPKRMDEVLTVGYPMGIPYVMVQGRVASLMPDRFLIDSVVVKGMSGSGVYSADGYLIGICVASWGDKDSKFMIAISQEAIKQFLKGAT